MKVLGPQYIIQKDLLKRVVIIQNTLHEKHIVRHKWIDDNTFEWMQQNKIYKLDDICDTILMSNNRI